MELKVALDGMEDAKKNLRSKEGVSIPAYMSEQMDRLATYTNAVEDYLAELEELIDKKEYVEFTKALKESSASAAEKLARNAISEEKGEAKKLKRLVDSAWRLIDEKKSRFNHLTKEAQGKI